MADKVSATISYLDSNQRKGMKAITDINPAADNSAVKSLCTGLNALTTNTLQGIEKIERTDITNATPKPKLELQIDSTQLATLAANDTATAAVFASIPMAYTFQTRPKLGVEIYCVDSSMGQYAFDQNAPTDRYATAGYINRHFIGAACKFTEATGKTFEQMAINFYFAETETTAATQYQLMITQTAGEATFVQL